MADWDEDVQMDTVDRSETLKSTDDSNKGDYVRKRRNDDGDNQGGFNRRNNNRDDNQNGDGGFRRRNRDNSQNNAGDNNSYQKRDNSQNSGFNRRRNNSNQDDNQGGNQGGFRRRNNNDNQDGNQDNSNQGNSNQGGFRRRNNNDNQDGNQGGGFRRRNNDNQDGNQDNSNQGGGFRRRNNNDNQDGNQDNSNQNGGYRSRNNDNQDGNQGGGFRRRNNDNQDDQNGQDNQGATFSRRRNQNNSEQDNNDGSDNQPRRRRNDNNDGNNQDSNDQQGERRRRNRESNDDGAPVTRPEEGADGKPKENYIPRRYNKEDDDLFENIIEGINFTKFDNIPVQVSGENLPDPIQRFSDVAKHESIIEAIKRSGYKTLTPIQKYGIAAIMAGRDLMASAQTGSGKTMAFLLPIVQKLVDDPSTKDYGDKCSPECLIVTPTRELAIQIYEQALKLTYKNELKAGVVYGGANSRDQQGRLSYGANIIAAVPGRLLDYLGKGIISLAKLKYFVLDEADRMIDQGFMPDVRRIISEFDLPEDRHTAMFSATFPIEVQKLAQQFLKGDYIFLSVGILGGANQDVKQEVFEVSFKEKKKKLMKILEDIYNPQARILIFTEKKKMADFLAANLCDNDYKTTSIHGDRLQSQREMALKTFKTGETPILVATSVAARGLDIKGVTHVINYDLPKEIEEYIHRIGRTGRVGNFGNAITFFDPNDNSAIAPSLVKALVEAGQEVPDFLQSYDDGTSFSNKTTERDQRGGDTEKSENFTSKNENFQAAVAEEDDW